MKRIIISLAVTLTLVAFYFFQSCEKNEYKPTVSMNKSSYQQFEIAIFSPQNLNLRKKHYDGEMGGKALRLVRVDNQLVAIVPALAEGGYQLSTKIEGYEYLFAVNVTSASSVQSPIPFINEKVNTFSYDANELERLISSTSRFMGAVTDQDDRLILDRYYNEFQTKFVKLTNEDKQALANFMNVNSSYFSELVDVMSLLNGDNLNNRSATPSTLKLEAFISEIHESQSKLTEFVQIMSAINGLSELATSDFGVALLATGRLCQSHKLYQHNKMLAIYLDKVYIPALFTEGGEELAKVNHEVYNNEPYQLNPILKYRTLYAKDVNELNVKIQELLVLLNDSGKLWSAININLPFVLKASPNHFKDTPDVHYLDNKTQIVNYLSIGQLSNDNVKVASQSIVNNKWQLIFSTEQAADQKFTFDVMYDDGEYEFTTTIGIKLKVKPSTSFKDSRDGEVYSMTTIGNQIWLAENMRYNVAGSHLNPANTHSQLGRLYTRLQAANVCPRGWHLPTDQEWMDLEKFLGMESRQLYATGWRGEKEGAHLKSETWINGVNSVGFNALPSGYYLAGKYLGLGKETRWWNSSVDTEVWYRALDDNHKIGRSNRYDDKSAAYSCRCMQD